MHGSLLQCPLATNRSSHSVSQPRRLPLAVEFDDDLHVSPFSDPRRAHPRERTRTARSRMDFSEIDAGGAGTSSQPPEHLARRARGARVFSRNTRGSGNSGYLDPAVQKTERPTRRYRSACPSAFLRSRADPAPISFSQSHLLADIIKTVPLSKTHICAVTADARRSRLTLVSRF